MQGAQAEVGVAVEALLADRLPAQELEAHAQLQRDTRQCEEAAASLERALESTLQERIAGVLSQFAQRSKQAMLEGVAAAEAQGRARVEEHQAAADADAQVSLLITAQSCTLSSLLVWASCFWMRVRCPWLVPMVVACSALLAVSLHAHSPHYTPSMLTILTSPQTCSQSGITAMTYQRPQFSMQTDLPHGVICLLTVILPRRLLKHLDHMCQAGCLSNLVACTPHVGHAFLWQDVHAICIARVDHP